MFCICVFEFCSCSLTLWSPFQKLFVGSDKRKSRVSRFCLGCFLFVSFFIQSPKSFKGPILGFYRVQFRFKAVKVAVIDDGVS